MLGDRTVEAFRRAVRRVTEDEAPVDFRALYPGYVVSQEGNTVTVQFDDRERLRSKSGIALAPCPPGLTLTVKPKTRVLVGWHGGDERNPYVAAAWLGDGGLVRAVQKFDDKWTWEGPRLLATLSDRATFDAPLVDCTGDERCVHPLAGGTAPTVTKTNGNVADSPQVIAGGDRMLTIQFIVTNNIPPLAPLFDVTLGKPYAGLFCATAQIVMPLGLALAAIVVPPNKVQVLVGVSPAPLAPLTYQATVTTGG